MDTPAWGTPGPSETPSPSQWSIASSRMSPLVRSTPKRALGNIRWTAAMVEALLETLVEQVEDRAGRADSGYKSITWQAAVDAVNMVTPPGLVITTKQARNRHSVCKADWKTWQALINVSGFNVEDGVVVGDLEALEAYFSTHKEAQKFRQKALWFEDLHRRLFDGVLATGEHAQGIDALLDSIEVSDDEDSQRTKKRAAETAGASKRAIKKLRPSEQLSQEVGRMVIKIGAIVDSMQKDVVQEAIVDFLDTYELLDDAPKYAIISGFRDEFLSKLYLNLSPGSQQKRWVKGQVDRYLIKSGDSNLAAKVEALEWEKDGKLRAKVDQIDQL